MCWNFDEEKNKPSSSDDVSTLKMYLSTVQVQSIRQIMYFKYKYKYIVKKVLKYL